MGSQEIRHSRRDMALLCAQVTHQDEAVSQAAVRRLFVDLVEKLCDSFSAAGVARYDKIFSQLIEHCRHLPEGARLDSLLNDFGLRTEKDMLARKKRISRLTRFSQVKRRRVKKICLLSRVTVGADVAVTGVVLSKLRRVFPGVPLVLIGPEKLREVFGGHPDISVRDVPYARRGGLWGRLNAWVDLVGLVHEERDGLDCDEFLVIDPDSRLTQLGLLPVLPRDRGYFFFESRTYKKAKSGRIGELTANWMDDVFGAGREKVYPEIFIGQKIRTVGKNCVARVAGKGLRKVVCINLGVGGNESKRISSAFEEDMIMSILKAGMAVILDKGFGDEVQRIDGMVSRIKESGWRVVEADEKNVAGLAGGKDWSCDLLTWEGGLAVFGAFIGSSDVYIGYDSGFQHIASAQAVPVVDIFMGAPSALFMKRWTPYGKNKVVIVGGYDAPRTGVTSKRILSALKRLLFHRS